MKNKQLLSIALGIFFLLGISFISAQNLNQNQEQIKNTFQNNYGTSYMNMCQRTGLISPQYGFSYYPPSCDFVESGTQIKMQVEQTRRFLWMNINMKSEYEINGEGTITKTEYNFWHRLFKGEKLV